MGVVTNKMDNKGEENGEVTTPSSPSMNLMGLKLISTHLVDVAADDSLLWAWSYPSIDPKLRTICLTKCQRALVQMKSRSDSESDAGRLSTFFHLESSWCYVFFVVGPQRVPLEESRKAKGVGIIVVGEDFNPEMYQNIAQALLLPYHKMQDPSDVLQQILNIQVTDMCLLPKKKTLDLNRYETSGLFTNHHVKEIISTFGLETIILYTALLKRRRIAVYHYDVEELSKFTLSLPFLSCDTVNWNIVYPWIDMNEEELQSIKTLPVYIMGCMNAAIESRTDLFDIFVNVPAAEIVIAPHARESIPMGKPHREIATLMVQLTTSEDLSEEEVVKLIRQHSAEIFKNYKAKGSITA